MASRFPPGGRWIGTRLSARADSRLSDRARPSVPGCVSPALRCLSSSCAERFADAHYRAADRVPPFGLSPPTIYLSPQFASTGQAATVRAVGTRSRAAYRLRTTAAYPHYLCSSALTGGRGLAPRPCGRGCAPLPFPQAVPHPGTGGTLRSAPPRGGAPLPLHPPHTRRRPCFIGQKSVAVTPRCASS